MAVSSRSSSRPRAATAARASCASMAVMGPTSANLSWSSVMEGAARALRSCDSQHAKERGPDVCGSPLVIRQELFTRAGPGVAHAARQPQQLGGCLGNPVHRAVAHDAKARLEPAEKTIPARERGMVLGREMAVLEEKRERLRRAGGADPGIGGAVCQLEELHSELHVDEA